MKTKGEKSLEVRINDRLKILFSVKRIKHNEFEPIIKVLVNEKLIKEHILSIVNLEIGDTITEVYNLDVLRSDEITKGDGI